MALLTMVQCSFQSLSIQLFRGASTAGAACTSAVQPLIVLMMEHFRFFRDRH
ncbi:hypothetical protein CHCC14817_0108 [Bacillus paralicheniformis]|nr:hypothetical protein SC10_B2orf01545 [Bacillus paralicheniformis]TWL99781.1 hypothetical protein CHCC15136_2157 [Bacillus paralicheniformis]TWM51707.1 hypothetical protein CHCC14817_0108 [Bacillus paralicheniformis]TWN64590.1 hypothetical protein CHCC12620_0289 [Bacillus paralicheniformis]TWN89535.1 hypothetical protein CHCC20491_2215 [Bacillus paralicheniformis]